jgi:glycosyltransferase involved in cell wall biosynthesis
MSNQTWILQGPLWTRSGYGSWAETIGKSLLRYIKDKPIDLYVAPTVWGACSKKNMDSEINDSEGRELLNRILKTPLQRQPEVFIQMTIPMEFSAPAKFNIGMTAGIESTTPRAEWLEHMNLMNLNIVLSKFNKDVFAAANYNKKLPNGLSEELKVRSPMETLFWGADTKIYKKTTDKIESVENTLITIPESFAFLFVGQWTHGNMRADRKAIGFLIKTFLEAFANVPNPPCLILKTSGAQICVMDRYDCITKINDVTNMVKSSMPTATLPNVYLLHGELEDNEMNALYNHEKVKAHISFVHGEGFGHPLLLATLSGKPLFAPKWSGHLDFLNPKYANLLEGNLNPIPDEALNQWFVAQARWFDTDYQAAGIKMKNIFNHYEDYLSNAEKLRLENMEKFSIQAMDKEFHALLDKYIPKFSTEQPIILPKLKKLNLPKATSATDGGAVPNEPSTTKSTSETTLTKV